MTALDDLISRAGISRVVIDRRTEELIAMSSYGPNRYICSVIEEMREQLKLLDAANVEYYRSLARMMIEEIQTLANRMEAALGDHADIEELHKKRYELKQEVKALKQEVEELKGESDDD